LGFGSKREFCVDAHARERSAEVISDRDPGQLIFHTEKTGVVAKLPRLVQTTTYRILQEALTNVARHARARRVAVELTLEDSLLQLVVRDDGIGFDVSAGSEASGLGLHGMQERVALLGGVVEVESRPGQGTMIRARIHVPN
jgi:signal transduction histidine kinase